MAQWDSEVTIDGALVRALLTEQFPELDASTARLVGEGWDNSVWEVEEEWAFRFPRREVAIPGVERELTVLPRLEPWLPVPIPVPQFVGRRSDRFPWPFWGARLLHGQEAADTRLSGDARLELGRALGRFLRVLHAPATREQVDPDAELPVDPLGRADMTIRVPRADQCLAEVESAGIWRAPAIVERILDDALRLPSTTTELLVHGDLHFRHVLVAGGSLAAVIDWGDVCVADPSIDLQLVWCLLPPAAREVFVAEYGPIDEERLLRARATALYFCAMLATYAHAVGHTSLQRECVAGLERTLVE